MPPTERMPEDRAAAIFLAAIDERRASELLECLWAGGSATVDWQSGKLVLVDTDTLAQLAAGT